MGNNPQRLCNRTAEAAVIRPSRYVIWDSDLKGFGLRVSPNGTHSWIVRYRAGGGRAGEQRFYGLGKYPTVAAPAARAAAAKVLAAAALGQDPVGEKLAMRRQMRVADLIDFYEAEGCCVQRGMRQGEPMKPRTKAYTLARLRHHVVPLLGSKRVADVNEGDIERLVRDVSGGKTAKDEKVAPRKRIIVRGGAGAARKVVRDFSAVLSFARRRRIIASNPIVTASIRKTDNRRERYLTIEEVTRLGAALDELEARGTNAKALNQCRLWALTGCRRDEVAGLKWAEVDFSRGLLVLDRSKTGRSIRPLGAAALGLLQALKRNAAASDVFVFPSERGKSFYQGTKQVWAAIVDLAGLPGVTPHTLRHTLGSAAASSGEALLMVGSLLGHANARSTAIYAHVQHDPARLAADRATAAIAVALGVEVPEVRGAANDDCATPSVAPDHAGG